MFQSEQLQNKWAPLLNYEGLDPIKDSHRRAVTAVLLENQERFLREQSSFDNGSLSMLMESPTNSGNAAGASGAFGGEQQATSVIGVRRKKYSIMAEMNEIISKLDKTHSERAMERLDSLRYEAKIHEYTVTVSLLKNKRPAGQLVDDIDYELDLPTGRLTQLVNGDLPKQYLRSFHERQF